VQACVFFGGHIILLPCRGSGTTALSVCCAVQLVGSLSLRLGYFLQSRLNG
jgi:hypothetical protein